MQLPPGTASGHRLAGSIHTANKPECMPLAKHLGLLPVWYIALARQQSASEAYAGCCAHLLEGQPPAARRLAASEYNVHSTLGQRPCNKEQCSSQQPSFITIVCLAIHQLNTIPVPFYACWAILSEECTQWYSLSSNSVVVVCSMYLRETHCMVLCPPTVWLQQACIPAHLVELCRVDVLDACTNLPALPNAQLAVAAEHPLEVVIGWSI